MEKKQWGMGEPSDHDTGLTPVEKRGKKVEWQMSLNDVLFEESFSKAGRVFGPKSLARAVLHLVEMYPPPPEEVLPHWAFGWWCQCGGGCQTAWLGPLVNYIPCSGRSERHILMATASYFTDKETDPERLGDIFKISWQVHGNYCQVPKP